MTFPAAVPSQLQVTFPSVDVTAPVSRSREAARVIAFAGECLLLVQSKYGDVKFPGGGFEEPETAPMAAARELFEETGRHAAIGPQVLTVTEQSPEPDGTFCMVSHYFTATLLGEKQPATLSASEQELGCSEVLLTLAEAIAANEDASARAEEDIVMKAKLPWLLRELTVLYWLQEQRGI